MKAKRKENKDIYQLITDRIIEKLEQGVIPWKKPWTAGGAPQNLISKKEYRGINIFLLDCAGYSFPYFLTYKQAQDRGGNVRKGEKGFPVVFWKMVQKKKSPDDPGPRPGEVSTKEDTFPVLRYYTVFNVEQCDGIEYPADWERRPLNPIPEAERIIQGMPNRPEIKHEQQRACYSPWFDYVNMPDKDSFVSDEAYYQVLFHELTHSTGHESRLKREGITDPTFFGSHAYSREELIAEMSATMLCGTCGIENSTIDNSAAYIQSWLGRLRNDKKLLVHAAGQAQKAADFILNRKWEENES